MKAAALILALALVGVLAGCVSSKQELATAPKPAAQAGSAPVAKRPMFKAVGTLDVAPAPAKATK